MKALSAAVLIALSLPGQDKPKVGYSDTPVIPGSKWRVHDGERPQPRVVTPGKAGSPPSDAVVLFNGTNLDSWKGRNGAAQWRLVDGTMEVNGTGDIQTVAGFGDCQLHLEFRTPPEIKGKSQGRGNSGVFFFGRYEIQILDSYDNPTYPDGQAAAIYGQTPPMVNASRKPGEWQTYDILFRAPRFDGDKLLAPAFATVIHNGVVVHHCKPLIGSTSHRRVGQYRPHGPTGSIKLQDHGNPIRFRNIWVRALDQKETDQK